ncbi:DUF7365 family protein [Streptococcus thermophilus]|uniref:DUF7365 domain-containing protein n=2 Tax=root TaxID=1 RepID=W6LLH5_9CAUD|nr:hypothetical protein [Streptococcus thermophilus]YP_009003395.1 holin [Streptococcus phage 20617]MDA3672842.1 hypothetical protein [Streptococcus thermophilus]MDA5412743.1 hypothetical protein [Streptococcus thermophilus]TDG54726.1 hypothetical protein C4K59_000457 [Streptococcus thermophilus]UEC18228.1 hypothetical protein LK438_10905 [Streptococcus thermophilus LMD-9]UEC18284.1 hypothetical protein LK438_11195 [Streptococcus thermophilus LMD-9]
MVNQTEPDLIKWILTVFIPLSISSASFYFTSQSRASRLEHRITKLEVVDHEIEKIIETHNKRLDKYQEEQKITLALVQRMDHLNENIGELKGNIEEVKKLVDRNLRG